MSLSNCIGIIDKTYRPSIAYFKRNISIRNRNIVCQSAKKHILKIGTRSSPLALVQANIVKSLLQSHFPELNENGAISIVPLSTTGDKVQSQPLSDIGGKGLFTKEIDQALLCGQVDIAVHSMKDVPTYLPEGICVDCLLEREDVRDVIISNDISCIGQMPAGFIVGTASLRRQAQILAKNSTLKVVNFRGNVQTRLNKLRRGDVNATLLAMAGLKRMNLDHLASAILDTDEMMPAVAQGAIGVARREDDHEVLRFLNKLNHHFTNVCVSAERAFLAALNGSCRLPIAGHAKIDEFNNIQFEGMVASIDGSKLYRTKRSACSFDDAIVLGKDAGNELRKRAGEDFISQLTQ